MQTVFSLHALLLLPVTPGTGDFKHHILSRKDVSKMLCAPTRVLRFSGLFQDLFISLVQLSKQAQRGKGSCLSLFSIGAGRNP